MIKRHFYDIMIEVVELRIILLPSFYHFLSYVVGPLLVVVEAGLQQIGKEEQFHNNEEYKKLQQDDHP